MKHLHPRPDRTEKSMIVFNVFLLVFITLTLAFYYNVFGDLNDHEQQLKLSVIISFFISITSIGVIFNKYIRNIRKSEEKIGKDIS